MSATALFSSPATHYLPLPNEIIHIIVFKHLYTLNDPIDYPTLDALSRTAPLFQPVCQSLIFRCFSFNLRHHDLKNRIMQFMDLLGRNPQLTTFVRELHVVDNMFPSLYKNEARFPIREPEGNKWLTHAEMDDDKNYHLIQDEEGIGAELASTLRTLSGLRRVSISFLYRPLAWEQLSTHFQRLLEGAITQQQYLQELRIQGVQKLPQGLLVKFSSLDTLTLLDVSIDPAVHIFNDPDDAQKIVRYRSSSRPKLGTLTLRNVPAAGALSLLQRWKENAALPAFHGVDMSCPSKIEIILGNDAEMQVAKQAILQASTQAKKLWIHAVGLGLDNTMMLDAVKSGMPPAHPFTATHLSIHNWFASKALILPLDLTPLTSLEQIKIEVSHWHNAAADYDEIQWALELLLQVPKEHLRTITLVVKIGGYAGIDDSSALDDFYFDVERIWSPWKEFGKEKWNKLELFVLVLQMPEYAQSMRMRWLGISAAKFIERVSDGFPLAAWEKRETRFQIQHLVRIDSGLRVEEIYRNTVDFRHYCCPCI